MKLGQNFSALFVQLLIIRDDQHLKFINRIRISGVDQTAVRNDLFLKYRRYAAGVQQIYLFVQRIDQIQVTRR